VTAAAAATAAATATAAPAAATTCTAAAAAAERAHHQHGREGAVPPARPGVPEPQLHQRKPPAARAHPAPQGVLLIGDVWHVCVPVHGPENPRG